VKKNTFYFEISDPQINRNGGKSVKTKLCAPRTLESRVQSPVWVNAITPSTFRELLFALTDSINKLLNLISLIFISNRSIPSIFFNIYTYIHKDYVIFLFLVEEIRNGKRSLRLSDSSPRCSRGLHLHPGNPSKTLISQFTQKFKHEVELALLLLIAVLLYYSTPLFWFLFFVSRRCGCSLRNRSMRIALLLRCVSKACFISMCLWLWLLLLLLVLFFDISWTLICFWQVEAEDHCTSQTRSLIDQISLQQERLLALEGGLGWVGSSLFLWYAIDSYKWSVCLWIIEICIGCEGKHMNPLVWTTTIKALSSNWLV